MTDELAAELTRLIKASYWTRGYKVLLCARDVADAVAGGAAPAPPPKPWEADLAALMAIDVIVTPDSPPGSWRLVRHDHCAVIAAGDEAGYVSHEGCTILGESLGSNAPE